MKIIKLLKNYFLKIIFGKNAIQKELLYMSKYFYEYGHINFVYSNIKNEMCAKSINFKYGTIIVFGKDKKEVEENIIDAVLTAFDIPSVFLEFIDFNLVEKSGKKMVYATT